MPIVDTLILFVKISDTNRYILDIVDAKILDVSIVLLYNVSVLIVEVIIDDAPIVDAFKLVSVRSVALKLFVLSEEISPNTLLIVLVTTELIAKIELHVICDDTIKFLPLIIF